MMSIKESPPYNSTLPVRNHANKPKTTSKIIEK
jgi:hypothetical protein